MITIKKKLIELVRPPDAIDQGLARGSKPFHITGWSKVGRRSPGWHRRNSERSKKLSYRLKEVQCLEATNHKRIVTAKKSLPGG